MVKDALWRRVVKPYEEAELVCLPCFEQRLGRAVKYEEFTLCPANTLHCARLALRKGANRENLQAWLWRIHYWRDSDAEIWQECWNLLK